jgi:hypothetical protein
MNNALSQPYLSSRTLLIVCFKIKNPPPVELCWQKKEIPRISSFCLGWPPTCRQNLIFSLSQISNYKNASKNKESFNC